jgi:transposase-like protein
VAKGKSFAPEFRQEAVRLYRVSGRPFRAVAGELGVAPESPHGLMSEVTVVLRRLAVEREETVA